MDVVNYAERPDDYPLPDVLRLEFWARRYHALPRAGGLKDQPVGLLRQMVTAGNVYDIITTYNRQMKTMGLLRMNKNFPDLVKQYRRLRKLVQESDG